MKLFVVLLMVNLNSCFGAVVGGCGSIEVSKNNKEVQEI